MFSSTYLYGKMYKDEKMKENGSGKYTHPMLKSILLVCRFRFCIVGNISQAVCFPFPYFIHSHKQLGAWEMYYCKTFQLPHSPPLNHLHAIGRSSVLFIPGKVDTRKNKERRSPFWTTANWDREKCAATRSQRNSWVSR